jgi:hypothetical protein
VVVAVAVVVVIVMETEHAIGTLDWDRKIIIFCKTAHNKPDVTLKECKE